MASCMEPLVDGPLSSQVLRTSKVWVASGDETHSKGRLLSIPQLCVAQIEEGGGGCQRSKVFVLAHA
jgi:hypothetical protein